MPQLVYTAVTSLQTLTQEQFACGMGEVIKHGLIMDADYYEWLQAIGRRFSRGIFPSASR